MKFSKLLRERKIIIGRTIGAIICAVAVFGSMSGQNLRAGLDLNLGGALNNATSGLLGGVNRATGGLLGGVDVDVSTDNFSFSTGSGLSIQAGCGGGNCLVAPDASEYSGIVAVESFREGILLWTNFFLGFLALIAMIFLIYSGFLYITAMGNDDQVKKAKNIIIWVVSGIIIILLAYALVNTLITTGPTGQDYQF